MIKKTFRSMVFLILFILLVCVGLMLGVIYNYFDKEFMTELESEAEYIGHGVEMSGEDYLKKLDTAGCRITWIGADGSVYYDNQVDASAMENHKNREEIKEAFANKTGESTRYSNTLAEKTTNYAILLDNGTVLRVSQDRYSILMIILGMIQPILVILALSLVIAALVAYRLSRRIAEPLNQIDLEHPEESDTYEELAPLLRKIEKQNIQIGEQFEELKHQQSEFSAITENMQEGFLVVDLHQKVLAHNSSALRLLNIPNGEAIEDCNIITLSRNHDMHTAIELALRGEHNEQPMQYGERCYHLFANPVMHEDEVSGAVVVILDVTEKEMRDKLRREFTANVSHELKTPLTSISGTAEIMGNGLVKAEDIPHFSNIIYKEAQRLITLVGDIIKLSKLEEADISMERESVNISEILADVLDTIAIPAKKKGITIQVKNEPCAVLGIASILDEMIYNLCDNAIKYNVENGSVSIRLEHIGRHVCLTVSDTGIGIPYEEQSRVFERFYRVDKSHSKEIGGTGLGLSIVKHAVAFHHAKMKLESEVGKGTTIIIIF